MNIAQSHTAEERHTQREEQDPLVHLRRRLATGQAAIDRRINGQDSEGAVEVVLAPGGRIEGVNLDQDWHCLQGQDRLPGAVLAAYRFAQASRLAEWADAVGDDQAPTGRPAEPNWCTGATPAADLRPDQWAGALQRAAAELPAALARISDLVAGRSTQHHDHVLIERRGAQVSRIEIDSAALAGDTALQDAIAVALRAAGEQQVPDEPLQAHPWLRGLLGHGHRPRAAAAGRHSDDVPVPVAEVIDPARQLLAQARAGIETAMQQAYGHTLPQWADLGEITGTTTTLLQQIHTIGSAALDRADRAVSPEADPARVTAVAGASAAYALRLTVAAARIGDVVSLPEGIACAVTATQQYQNALAEAGSRGDRLAG